MPSDVDPTIDNVGLSCTATPVTYAVANPIPLVDYHFTVNGDTVAMADTFRTNWPAAGTYELCLHADNICMEPAMNCYDILVTAPETIVDTLRLCSEDCGLLANGESVCEEGDYDFSVTDAGGCRVDYRTTVRVLPPDTTRLAATLCLGDTLTYRGQSYFSPGTYASPQTNGMGCDSLVLLTIMNANCPVTGSLIGEGVSCYGLADGRLTLRLDSGRAPYSVDLHRLGQGRIAQRMVALANIATVFTDLVAGTYLVEVTDNFGNEGFFNQNIREPTPLIAQIGTSDYNGSGLSCYGRSDGELSISISGGTEPYAVSWADGPAGTRRRTGLSPGNYRYQITDQNGCTVTGNTELTGPDAISLRFSVWPETCDAPGSGGLSIGGAEGGTGALSVELYEESGEVSVPPEGLSAGEYVIVVSDENGCRLDTTFTVGRPVSATAQIIASPATVFLGRPIELRADYDDPPETLRWDFPGVVLDCGDCRTVTFIPPHGGTVLLETVSRDGCTSIDSLQLSLIPDYGIYFPTAFSPNGDGVNDIFRAFSGPSARRLQELRVYDRWGGEVYRLDGVGLPMEAGTGWDGRVQGRAAPPGAYVWVATVGFLDGTSRRFGGQVTLLR